MNFDPIKQALNLQIQQVITGKTEQNSIDPVDVGSMMSSIVDAITPFLNHVVNFTASGLPPASGAGADDDVHFQIGTSFTVWQKISGSWSQKGSVPFGITVPNGNGTVQSSVNGMVVTSSSGVWWINNTQYAKATPTQFTIPSQHPTLPRIDAVFGNNVGTGALTYQEGTAADAPLEPATPANSVMITYIYVPSVASGQTPYIANTNSGGPAPEPETSLKSVTAEAPNIDFVADAFGGYYLPFGMPEGQSVIRMIVTNADDSITHSYPDYDSEAQAIPGFASNDAKKVKIFYTNI